MTEAKVKRTRVNIVNKTTWAMCSALPNVVENDSGEVVAEMCDTLYNAAVSQPTWTFKTHGLSMSRPHIDVYHKDEKLAVISRKWSGRAGEYIIFLEADRLPYMRRRGSQFSSKDAAPVLRKFREYVYPRTLEEKLKGAIDGTQQNLYNLERTAAREVEDTKRNMHKAAVSFAFSSAHMQEFLAYERTFGAAEGRNTDADMEKHEAAKDETALFDRLRTEAGNGMALVMRNAEGWMVKFNNEFKQYEEDALPTELTNVHVLQLAPENKALQNIGVRLGNNVFVVFPILA